MKVGESLGLISARIRKLLAAARKPIVIKTRTGVIRFLEGGMVEIKQKQQREGSLAVALGKKRGPVVSVEHPWLKGDIVIRLPAKRSELFEWLPAKQSVKEDE